MWVLISPILVSGLFVALVIQIVENITLIFTGPEESEDEPKS